MTCNRRGPKTCPSCKCFNCSSMYAHYGFTLFEMSGLIGSMTLYEATTTLPATFPGFTTSSISLPNAQGGPCDDTIPQNGTNWGGFGRYKINLGDIFGVVTAGSFGTRPTASGSNTYVCTSNIPSNLFGVSVAYRLGFDDPGTQFISNQFSEGSFTDWTWSGTAGASSFREAIKIFPDGSTAKWGYDSNNNMFASVYQNHIASGLTTVSMPTFPYDPMGFMIGTGKLT